MRPLELTIEGLRSFRTPVTLDLRGRDQIAIVGDTGAGKSSIIEAITYALYGQATFAGLNRELMNDTATQLRVVLRFQVGDEEWEVVRTLRRRAAGTVGTPIAQLSRFAADGELRELHEQVRPVNERIEAVIGLNRDAFLRTTVLPQGRFAQLLVEDDPRARSTILRQVWRTDELEAAGQLAAAARQQIATLRARIDQAAAGYPEDPPAHLEQLRKRAEEARRAADHATATQTAAATAHRALEAAEAQRGRAAAAAARLGGFSAPALAAELAPLAAQAEELDGQESDLRERGRVVAAELSRIPADDDGPAVAAVATALTTLRGIPRLAEEAAGAAAELQERSTAAERRRAAAEPAAAAAESATEAVAAHAVLGAPLEQARLDAGRRRERVLELHTAAHEAADAVGAARQELERSERIRGEVAAALGAASAETERRAQDASRAEEHLAAAQRSESAVLIAGGLHPGDECPICRRALAPEWRAPAGGDLGAAKQEAAAARAAATQARETEVTLAARRDSAVEAAAAAAERLRAAAAEAADRRRALAEAAGSLRDRQDHEKRRAGSAAATDAAAPLPKAAAHLAPLKAVVADPDAPLPAAAAHLAPLEAAVSAAVQAVADHTDRRDALQREAAQQAKAAAIAAELAGSAEQFRNSAAQAATAALVRLRQAVADVPQPYRPALNLSAQPADLPALDLPAVDFQIAAARSRERVLAERTGERDRLNQLQRAITLQQTALTQRRTTAVDEPLAVLGRGLNAHRDVLARSALELALEPDLPGALTATQREVVAARIDRLGRITAELLQAAGEQTEQAATQSRNARAALQAIGRHLGVGDNQDEPAVIVAVATSAAESARYAARATAEAAEAFAANLDQVLALRELLGEILERERALADLEAALKEGAFLKWLTLRRSRDLLVHASRTLEQISGGRYAFVEPADEFERWRVLDRDSGQPRSPASLSGGEQFIASLALALGMVEMMARSGGRLESLFLDEGFGSLDRTNLDAAIEALGMVAAGGRMVVLISHVQAVAEQVAHVAMVTRTHTGSRIEWLSEGQRRQLVETEAGAASLGGLLE